MSYLTLVRQIETRQAAYRAALRLYWATQEPEAYQQVLCLLDDLGIAQADTIHSEERQAFGAYRS
jgi:hypothetical protein